MKWREATFAQCFHGYLLNLQRRRDSSPSSLYSFFLPLSLLPTTRIIFFAASMSNRGHDTDPTYFLACGAGFLSICTVVVAARFYTRIGQKAKIGIDDWLTLPALVCAAFLLYSDFRTGKD